MAPELAQQIQTIARELANVEQGIDQLKTEQSQMVRDTAELAKYLKATQEIALHNADLTENLKATQAQMARDNGNIADQLKASQDLMTGIAEQLRQRREQVARLVASEQKPQPRPRASSPQTVASSTRRQVPTPPQPPVSVRTQDSGHLQPKQQ
jgi:septal ring factor EnvC (AmiA/AmiB activator)